MSEFEQVLEFHNVLQTERNDHIVVVTPLGEAFGFRYADIQTEYNRVYQLFEDNALKHLVFDLSQLTYLDSTFIGICLSLAKKSKLNGGRAILAGLSPDVRELLKKAQLIENAQFTFFWTEVDTRATAVAQLNAERE